MRKKDDLSDLKAAIVISKQNRLKRNLNRLCYATSKGAELEKKMEDRDFVSYASDKELQYHNPQSQKELFSKNTLENNELLLSNEDTGEGEIIPKNE